jgi:pimeloyl-ACP methyl ester carboxylesterase
MEGQLGAIGRLPFLAAGGGPPLLFLGGLSPESGVEGPRMRRTNLAAIAPYTSRHRVLFVNRRKGLARGMTISDLAAEHAEAIDSHFGGPVDVLGASTGGSIAQQLAADHPHAVARLVLLSTACRLSAHGRELQRRVAARIRRGANRQALALLASELVPPRRGQLAAGALAWAVGAHLFTTADLQDAATTIEAEDSFDLARCEQPIGAPTLIVAGGKDRFYTRELFEETARLIPDSRLRVFDARGHITVASDKHAIEEIEGFLAR